MASAATPLLSVNSDGLDDIIDDRNPETHSRNVFSDSVRNARQSFSSLFLRLTFSGEPLQPSGTFRSLSYAAIVFFTLYNGIVIPMRLAFRSQWTVADETYVFAALDYIGDVVFVIDIALSFRTGFVDRGIINTNRSDIFQRYLKTWFWLDVFSVLPLADVFVWHPMWLHVVLRCNRLLRLAHLQEYFGTWETSSQQLHSVLFAKLLALLLLVLQFVACAYMALVYAVGFGEDDWVAPSSFETAPLWDQWLEAFFWSTRIVTDVGGDTPSPLNTEEKVFMCVVSLFLIFVAAGIVASVIDLVESSRASSNAFQLQMAQINLFMANKNLSDDLRLRVRQHFVARYSRTKGALEANASTFLSVLPTRLRTKVAMHMNGDILRQVPLFASAEHALLHELAQRLKEENYAPGDLLCCEGTDGNEMFFISRGTVEIVVGASEDPVEGPGSVVGTLGEGKFFGEIALLTGAPRTATVRAVTHCRVFVLTKRDMDSALSAFPAHRKTIASQASVRLANDALRQLLGNLPPLLTLRQALKAATESSVSKAASSDGESLQPFIDALCATFTPVKTVPGDFLVKRGTVPVSQRAAVHFDGAAMEAPVAGDFCVYFIGSGTVDVLDAFGLTQRRLVIGTSLSEATVVGFYECLLGVPYRVSVRVASADTTVLAMRVEDLFASLHKFCSESMRTRLINAVKSFGDRYCFSFKPRSDLARSGRELWRKAVARVRVVVHFQRLLRNVSTATDVRVRGKTHVHNRNWVLALRVLADDAGLELGMRRTEGAFAGSKMRLMDRQALLNLSRRLAVLRLSLTESICEKLEAVGNSADI